MTQILYIAFLKLLDLSMTASWWILAVIFIRRVCGRMPAWIRVLLWGLAGLRLISPFTIQTAVSVIPPAKPSELLFPAVSSGDPVSIAVPQTGSPVLPAVQSVQNTFADPVGIIWLAGVLGMLGYMAVTYWKLRISVREAVPYAEGIWISDSAGSPFVLGLIHPKIYLSASVDPDSIGYVLAHERAHLSRLDHLWKVTGWLILSVYWFNPLIWIAFILFQNDIETACDEKVIRDCSLDEKKKYAKALMFCSENRKEVHTFLSAFGEIDVKERIRKILDYRKPSGKITITALVIIAVCAVFLLTDPMKKETANPDVAADPSASSGITTSSIITSTKKPILDNMDEIREYLHALPDDPSSLEPVFINRHNSLYHADAWNTFITDSTAGKSCSVTIASYTIEGDVVYTYLQYDQGMYLAVHDNSRDKFGKPEWYSVQKKNLYLLETVRKEEVSFNTYADYRYRSAVLSDRTKEEYSEESTEPFLLWSTFEKMK